MHFVGIDVTNNANWLIDQAVVEEEQLMLFGPHLRLNFLLLFIVAFTGQLN